MTRSRLRAAGARVHVTRRFETHSTRRLSPILNELSCFLDELIELKHKSYSTLLYYNVPISVLTCRREYSTDGRGPSVPPSRHHR